MWRLLLLWLAAPMSCSYDTESGPTFLHEPPPRLDFTSAHGGLVDCMARGNPEPVVEWMAADGSPIAGIPSLRVPLANGSLFFPPFPAENYRQDVHGAVYRCVATNSVGTVLSRDMAVRAVVSQHYDAEVQSPGGILGNTVIMRCTVPAFVRDFVTVTSWLQEPAFNIYPSTVSDGKYHMLASGELLISDVTRADAAKKYRCRTHHTLTQESVVSVNAGTIQLTELRGEVAPILYDKLVSLSARLDETVVVPCVAYANPKPTYAWFAKGESARLLVREGTLVLPHVQRTHAGSYFCNVSNAHGSEVMELRLSVTAPLSAHVHPPRVVANLGGDAELTCAIAGFPHSTPVWLKDGAPLREGARVRLPSPERLQLLGVGKEQRGMYQCVVRSERDMAQCAAELRLGEVYPTLMYRFIEQTLQPGPAVSLKCSASGNPTPHITWTLDGFPLTHNSERLMIGQYVSVFGDVISHVNMTSVRAEDGGEYACVAENRAGRDSHAARLNVYGLPYVRSMPAVTAVAGKPLEIKCPVAGYPIDVIYWEKDGARLPLDVRQRVRNGSLRIENVQRGSDQGAYTCVARNKQGHASQRSVDVTVMVPPKITPFSFGRDLNVGERTSIQCVVVTGDLPLTFTWLKDNISVTGSEVSVRQYDDFTSSLSIVSIAKSHSGNYTCRVSNGAATAQHMATLHVNVAPRISPFLFEEISEGMRTQVMCSVSQGDQPLSISWLKDGIAIFPSATLDISQFSGFSSVLAIASVGAQHSGNYTCVASNRAGNTAFTAPLSVTVPPHWVVEPNDVSVMLGQPVTLKCEVEGFPKPSVTWKQAIGSTPGEYRELGFRGQRMQVQDNGSLTIARVAQDSEGYYLCQANNGIGAGLSKLVHLDVHVAPKIQSDVRNSERVRKGDTLMLRCQMEGDLPLEVTWRSRGIVIDSKFDTRVTVQTNERVSQLTVADVSQQDSGDYECVARNEYGSDQLTIHVTVQEPPNFPRNLHVAEQSSRRLVLAWASDASASISSYVLHYKQAADAWHEHGLQQVVGGEQTSAAIENLKPATMYHFRLYAENQLGTSAPSDVLHGMTSGERPAGPPLHVKVEAVTSRQLRVTWHSPERTLWNGEILGYYVGYKKFSQSSRDYNFTRVSQSSETSGDLRLNGLAKFTKYSVVVKAFNAIGDGPLSEPLVVQTLEDVPSAPPHDVQCAAVTSQSLQLRWQPPSLSQSHGVIQGYRVFYESAEETPDAAESKMTTSPNAVLHGLRHFTNYSVQLLAFTSAGDGVRSLPTFCVTEETVPEAPEQVKAVATSESSVMVSWLPPRHMHGVLTQYTVHVRGAGRVSKWALPPQQLHYAVQHVTPGAEAWVTASTKAGQGPSTPVVSLVPSSIVPAAVVTMGRALAVAWRTEVRLACLVVGVPRPSVEWRKGDVRLPRDAGVVTPEHTLILHDITRATEGNFTCHARNTLGSDHITYSLQVQVPPTVPILLATSVTASSVQLQWKQGDNGGASVRGFVLAYQSETKPWKEISLDRRLSTYLVTGLQCGTHYSFRLSAFNRIGRSQESRTESARTSGSRPVAPSAGQFLHVNSTGVTLYLDTWAQGGCPILHFSLQLSAAHASWKTVSNNVEPQPRYLVAPLDANTHYVLRVTALNAAGSTAQEYAFNTLLGAAADVTSHDVVPDNSIASLNVLAPLAITSVAVLIAAAALCLCLRRKPAAAVLPDCQTSATLDNKANMEQRELQYYATVRKPMPSPIRDISTLERIPEYSEDIYPYATFHLADAPHALMYTDSETLPLKQVRSRSRRRTKSESEEYDTLGEESNTESSNQLLQLHRGSMYRRRDSSTSSEASPTSERVPRTKHRSRHSKRDMCSEAECDIGARHFTIAV